MPSFSADLEKTLHHAIDQAAARRHSYATLEHLLYSLTEDLDSSRVMRACGVDVEELRQAVTHYLDTELDALKIPVERPRLPRQRSQKKSPDTENDGAAARRNAIQQSIKDWDAFEKDGPSPTSGFQRVVQRSILHVQSSGKEEVNGANVLVALFSERESYAVYFLQQQDMSRLDAVSFLSHGVSKQVPVEEPVLQRGGPETPPHPVPDILPLSFRSLTNDLRPHPDAVSSNPVLSTPMAAGAIVDFLTELSGANRLEKGRPDTMSTLAAVGIFGPWGSGKSTLLHAIAERFRGDGAITVQINAWRWHGRESIYDFMTSELIKSISAQKNTKIITLLLKLLTFSRKNIRIISISFSLMMLAVILFYFRLYNNLSHIPIITSALAAISAVSLGLIVKPAARILEKIFISKKLISDSEKLSRSYSYLNFARNIGLRKTKNHPIVFIFDDIDRCEPVRVVEFLQSIHRITYSGSISIIACDEKFVHAAIYSYYKTIADISGEAMKFAPRFLEKIIQVHFRIPALMNGDLESLGIKPVNIAGTAEESVASADAAASEHHSAAVGSSNLVKDLTADNEVGYIALSIICGDVLEAFIEPYRVHIRKIKMISNIVKLYAMILRPDEEMAYRMAILIALNEIDPDWISVKYHQLENDRPVDNFIRLHLGDDQQKISALLAILGIGDIDIKVQAS